MSLPRDGLTCLFIFCLSLGMGLVQWVEQGYVEPEYHAAYFSTQGSPWSDAMVYDRQAIDLLQGIGLQEGFMPNFAVPRAPAYSAFVAAVYQYLGHRPRAVALLQMVMVALTCVAIYIMGTVAFSRIAGSIAAIALAAYQPMYSWASMVMTEIPFVFVLAMALLGVFTCDRKLLPSAVAGAWAALGIALRPSGLLPMVLMLLYLVPWKGRTRWHASLASPLAFLIAVVVILAPLLYRNYKVCGSPTVTSTNHVGWLWTRYARGKFTERAWADVIYFHPNERELLKHMRRETREVMLADKGEWLRKIIAYFVTYYSGPPFTHSNATPLDFLLLPVIFGGALLGIYYRPNLKIGLLAAIVFVLMLGNSIALLPAATSRYRFVTDWLVLLLMVGGVANCVETWLKRGQPEERTESVHIKKSLASIPVIALALLTVFMAIPTLKMSFACWRTARDKSIRAISDKEILEAFGPVNGEMAVRDRAHQMTFADYQNYVMTHHGDVSPFEGRLVAWRGLIESVVVLPTNKAHPWAHIHPILAKRPDKRTIATFRVDGEKQRGLGRVWLEIPEKVGQFKPNSLTKALVLARAEAVESSPLTERYRLVAVAISKEG